MLRYIRASIILIAMLATACSSDPFTGDGDDLLNAPQSVSQKVITLPNGAQLRIGASDIVTANVVEGVMSRTTNLVTAQCKGDDDHADHKRLNIKVVDSHLDIPALAHFILDNFPEEQRNLEIAHPGLTDLTVNFAYISDGNPFVVTPVYTGAGTNTDLSIYYYDLDGVYHQQTIWRMDAGWAEGDISAEIGVNNAKISTDGKGFEVTLPEGYEFGFMVWNGKSGRHFTQMDENLKHPYAEIGAPEHNEVSAVQFSHDGVICIGFENAWDLDADYNDIMIAVTPLQKIRSYTTDVLSLDFNYLDVDFTCQSDDTNIKIGDKLLSIDQIDNTFNLKLNAGQRFSISLMDLDLYEPYWRQVSDDTDELVLDIRLYNYNVTPQQVLELLGITDDDEKYADDSWNIEGILGSRKGGYYGYNLNVGLTDDQIHLSLILRRPRT